MHRPGGAASPRVAELTANEAKALDLRIAGHSFRAIGAALGTGPSTAYRWVTDALAKSDEAMAEKAKDHREAEAQRLDVLTRTLWPKAAGGDGLAIDRVLRVMERRAKLLGLDAPARNELSGPDGGPLQTETVARVVLFPPLDDDAGHHLASQPGAADAVPGEHGG